MTTQTKQERMRVLFDKWNVPMECDEGWVDILEDLDKALAPYSWVQVEQVKEKFGTLRFYWGRNYDLVPDGELPEELPEGEWEQVDRLVDEAEELSSVTCERTGGPGVLMKRKKGFWLKTIDPQIAGEDWVPAR